MRVSPPQYSMSSGEISPLLYGRPDYQRHQTGLELCNGFLPLRQGGVTRMPGTTFLGNTRNNERARFISFEFAIDDTVLLEFTEFAMRVWRYGELVMDGLDPYELVTPYSFAALRRVKVVQSADVIYMVNGTLPPQRLERRALDDWAISDVNFRRGPFQLPNTDSSSTVQSDSESGTCTLTASENIFSQALVGSLMLLETVDDDVPTWVGNAAVSIGDRVRFDGRIYQLEAGTNTGVNPPVHSEGTVKVDIAGTTWRFLTEDSGIVRITSVSGLTADANVIRRLPQAIRVSGTYRYSFGAWSDRDGYPSAVAIYQQRLVLANTLTQPRTVWFSTAGDLEDFEPSIEDDGSFAYNIAGGRSLNEIIWIEPGSRGLHIGALGEEYSTRSTDDNLPIAARTAEFRLDSSIGTSEAQPIAPDGKPIFITRNQQRVYELRYAFAEDSTQPVELSLPADHLGAGRFRQIEWSSAPLRLGWLRRSTGDLVAMIHDPQEEVLGWAPCSFAGNANLNAIAVSKTPDGTRDVLYCVVRREINGQEVRYVEEQAPFYADVVAEGDPADAIHLFASKSFTFDEDGGTLLDGLEHLEGETVYIWTNLGELGPQTVTGGEITLELPVQSAVVGLFDETHVVRTLDLMPPVRDGSAQGRRRRLRSAAFWLRNTSALSVVAVSQQIGRAPVRGDARNLVPDELLGEVPQLVNGVVDIVLPSSWDAEQRIEMRPIGGAPATVTNLVPTIDVSGN